MGQGEGGGRPLKFTDVAELQTKIDAYFVDCDKQQKPYTISGLALWLDVCTVTLRNYQANEKFFSTIKAAKQKVERLLEERLYGANVTGIIFNLKNNFEWKDAQDLNNRFTDKNGNDLNVKVNIGGKPNADQP